MRRGLILTLVLLAAATAAKAGVPLRERLEPRQAPAAWFVQKEKGAQWCAFTDRQAVEAYFKASPDDVAPGQAGWLRTDHGRLISITLSTQSEDAYVEDRYLFDGTGTLTEMRRTGHYVHDQFVTVSYGPDGKGGLSPTKAGRAVIAEMERVKLESYWVDWPVRANFDALPFRALIQVRAGAAQVTSGCIEASAAR